MSEPGTGDDALFQSRGTELIAGLFVVVRVALLHRMDNQATAPALGRFLSALSHFRSDVAERAAMQFVGDAVYVNRRLVHTDIKSWKQAQYLAEFFAKMRLAEIEVEGGVSEEVVRAFIQAVRDVTLDQDKAAELHARTFEGIRFRDLHAKGAMNVEALAVPDRFRVLRAYGLLYVTLQEILRCVRTGERARVLPVRRAVQELVWLPERTRGLQLALLQLGAHRGELAGRLAYVGVLVSRMCKTAGSSAVDSREVAVAAALSGVGRALEFGLSHAGPDLLARSNAFAGGARALLSASGRGRHVSLRLIAAVEQSHPKGRREGHPVSRLTAAAAAYERLTHAPPIGAGLVAVDALAELLARGDIDPACARLVANTVGLFPPGCLVKLDTGETAVVRDVPTSDSTRWSPPVLVVAGEDGHPVPLHRVDLAVSGSRIVGTVDAESAGLNATHYLFGSQFD